MAMCLSANRAGDWAANVIPFSQPARLEARLSMRDRMDVVAWRERASGLGFDRLVIHERSSFDPPDVDNFLSIYRRDMGWARWSLARRGEWVLAWCAGTGADVGRYSSVSEALRALLATA